MMPQVFTLSNGAGPGEPAPSSPAEPLTPQRVFAEYAPRVYRLARLLLGNDTDAEDVTQQVFLQVVRKLSGFRGDSTLSTWLNRVAVNAALAYRKQRGLRHRHELSEPPEEFTEGGSHVLPVRRPPEPLPELLARELHEQIDRALLQLPEMYRDVFVLADVEERPNQEVADLLGLSLPAVKSRLHRARLLMRQALAPYFEEKAA